MMKMRLFMGNSKHCLFFVLLLLLLGSCGTSTEYDVVIYGGTPAGITTAISLAKKEKKVLLVVQQQHVGGMYAGGLMTAEVMHMKNKCISGMAHDYYMKVGLETPEGFYHKFKPGEKPAYFFECKTAEKVFVDWLEEYKAFITLEYAKEVTQVVKKQGQIKSISLSGEPPISANYFVDCSYEGDLLLKAGISYSVGREYKDAFNETFAGVRFQQDTLYGTTVDADGKRLPYFQEMGNLKEGDAHPTVNAYNFRSVLTKIDSNKVAFTQPEDYDHALYYALGDFLERNPETELRDLFGIIKRGNGKTGFNTRQGGSSAVSVGLLGMQRDYPLATYAERDSIRAFYEKYTKGLFYFLSTDEQVPNSMRTEMASYGYAKDEFIDNEHFPYYFYIREGVRLKGDFIFTEKDILKNRTKEDAILLGSHWLDCHSIQKIALSDTSYINEGNIWEKITQPYEIPYQVMLPAEKECTNLLVPVAVSASHVGFCSIRLESTWMQLGHAAGVAIAQAIDNQTALHRIEVAQLQETLRTEGMVVKLEEFEKLMEAKRLAKQKKNEN